MGHEIDAAAQPLPTGDPGGADFTENANACPLAEGSVMGIRNMIIK